MVAKKPKPHGRRYPWQKWFASDSFVLRRGVDFDCLPHGMAQTVRNVAGRYGWDGVQIKIEEDRITVTKKVSNGQTTGSSRTQVSDRVS